MSENRIARTKSGDNVNIPPVLRSNDLTKAISLVGAYYAARFDDFPSRTDNPKYFSGAFFDDCSPDPAHVNEFTETDVLALSMLSIRLDRFRTAEVLYYRREQLSELLAEIDPDRELAKEPGPLPDDWPARRLEQALRDIKGIGQVTAAKLVAHKRPRLFPVFDKVVGNSIAPKMDFLDTVHAELSTNVDLRDKLGDIRTAVGLPKTISELRILDVIAWMDVQYPELASYQAPSGERSFMTV
ncbi:MAG: DUF6308 family protein [Corynebacterium sp.]|uniref:DUF6308 family protein n=1 Tax=Corynebacterium sp. TaxID=1720 RepID=UPI003F081DC4